MFILLGRGLFTPLLLSINNQRSCKEPLVFAQVQDVDVSSFSLFFATIGTSATEICTIPLISQFLPRIKTLEWEQFPGLQGW